MRVGCYVCEKFGIYNKKHYAKGLCKSCYNWVNLSGRKPEEIIKWKTAGYPKICEQYGCYRLSYKGTFCATHRKIKTKSPKFIEI